MQPVLSLKNLCIHFDTQQVLHNISFDVHSNEIIGIVGESGSGKSVTSLAILRLLDKKAKISGDIIFEDKELLSLTEKNFRKIRGNDISMIFQEPMSSLNPSQRCGNQVGEVLKIHTRLSSKAIKNEVLSLFEKVKLPNPEQIFNRYPHQISGGQKQRVMIAMAIACKPKLLIADEPTTALDVTVQNEILNLLKSLQQETKMSVLFISHDLNVVSKIADRVVVMYKGKLMEQGKTTTVFHHPNDTYTKALLASKPSAEKRLKKLPTLNDFLQEKTVTDEETTTERFKKHLKLYQKEPLLRIENVNKTYVSKTAIFGKVQPYRALSSVSLSIYEGETLGLVGESGCGKTTLGKTILQLEKPDSGAVFYRGTEITKLSAKAMKALRKDIQMIFQDPYSSLNPKMKVGEAVMEPMQVHQLYKNDKQRREKALELFRQVGLEESHFNRYPHEFSGGQRQRIGIARAIALQPKLVICDESVSALDISVQAQVLNLLNELKDKQGFTYLFISHDLSVVKYMSDRIAVMQKGQIEELNEADTLYRNPQKEYTKTLLKAQF